MTRSALMLKTMLGVCTAAGRHAPTAIRHGIARLKLRRAMMRAPVQF